MKSKITALFALVVMLGIFAPQAAKAEEGHKIRIKIDNYKGKKLYLLNYYAKNTLFKDTTEIDSKGWFVFEGKEALQGGMYVALLESKSVYFEFMVDKDQHFDVTTDSLDLVKNAKFKGSEENTEFYDYLAYIDGKHKELNALQKEKKEATTAEAKKKADKKLEALNKEVLKYQKDYYTQKPDRLFSAVLRAGEEPEIPTELPLNEDGEPDSTYIFRHYKAHFFDGFNFDDDRLLHTNVYAQKLERYYKQLIMKHPDSVIKEGDRIIQMAKGSFETYKYTIWFFTYQTETSQIMFMDEAFVFFAEKYYLSGEATWVTDAIVENMRERVRKLKPLGKDMLAPNMILIDTNDQWVSLHAVPANYTVVVFWDPDCGHCRTEMPLIKDWVEDEAKDFDVKVFAVCSDTNLRKWRKEIRTKDYTFINVNGTRSATRDYHDLYDIISTPVIYILDKDKKILAKKVNHGNMEKIIERDYKQKYMKE